MNHKIMFESWKPGLNTVKLIRLIQNEGKVSLSSAKFMVETLLQGKTIEIQTNTFEEARSLLNRGQDLGALGKII